MTEFPHGNQYVAPEAKRLTATRRLELVAHALLDRKAALRTANEAYGASEAEIDLWIAAFKAHGMAGLTSSGLTHLARERSRNFTTNGAVASLQRVQGMLEGA